VSRRPARTQPRRAHHAAGLRERGSSTIQMVVLLPALFSLMFLGVQAGLHYQGRAVALAAAQEGAREAASEHGTTAAGVSTARTYITNSSVGLHGTTVQGARTLTEATITVTTHTLSVIPGWRRTIQQSASMPVERVTG
jgi:Flp pilus assembly protein TadG